jgi:hypothetical protein
VSLSISLQTIIYILSEHDLKTTFASSSVRGLPVQRRANDLGPQLLRVQGPVQGPQAKGFGHVPPCLGV